MQAAIDTFHKPCADQSDLCGVPLLRVPDHISSCQQEKLCYCNLIPYLQQIQDQDFVQYLLSELFDAVTNKVDVTSRDFFSRTGNPLLVLLGGQRKERM